MRGEGLGIILLCLLMLLGEEIKLGGRRNIRTKRLH